MTAIAVRGPQKTLQVIDQGAHQVGEEDREEECDQGGAGDVKKTQTPAQTAAP